jgi:hypothetical protein
MFLRRRKAKSLCGSPAFNIPGSFGSQSYGVDPQSLKNGKIVVFGLPKSGNVWLVSLLSDYLEMESIDPYVEIERAGVGMCHLPYGKNIAERGDFIHGVYLVRDLRDVIVSYFYHTQRADWRKGFPHYHCDTIHQFYFEWFLPRVTIAHDINNHGCAYAEAGLPIIRYEDLYESTESEFARLIKRLGFTLDPDKVSKVVDGNKIEVLKKIGKELDVRVPIEHFRRGGHGGYKKELPRIVLEHVNARFGNIIRNFGYEL